MCRSRIIGKVKTYAPLQTETETVLAAWSCSCATGHGEVPSCGTEYHLVSTSIDGTEQISKESKRESICNEDLQADNTKVEGGDLVDL